MSFSLLKGLGPFTIASGETKKIKPADFGGGQRQFAVGTTQAIGSTLYAYLCDPDGAKVSTVHPGPPISFETDSAFVLRAEGGSVTFVVGIVQGFGTSGPRKSGSGGGGDGGSNPFPGPTFGNPGGIQTP